MNSLIKPSDYISLYLDTGKRHVLVDARSGDDAVGTYAAMHLKGAVHAHLELDLSNIREDARYGGRHPLPEPSAFAFFLGRLGIGPRTHVIVYDDKGGANAAARFWWMLRAAGHKHVKVLDGGFDAAIRAGIPASNKPSVIRKKMPYLFDAWALPQADMQEVFKATMDDSCVIIDVREADRYHGLTEPYDHIAGHIPSAINIPYAGNLDQNGFFLPPEKLRQIYEPLIATRPPEKVIVHCGSGVSACHTLLALDQAGLEIPALYTGSYSEWIRNNKPIIKK